MPEKARQKDIIMVLYGCSVPVVVRPSGDHYVLIGECYIHGAMDGLISKLATNHEERNGEGRRYGIAGHKHIGGPKISADMIKIVDLR